MLRLAATVPEPNRDVTFVFYEAEEIDDGVQRPQARSRRADPELLAADFAILMEPSNARRRGRLPGHHARRRHHARRARPLGAQLAWGQRDPQGGRRSSPGSQAYEARTPGHRRAGVPRGPQRRRSSAAASRATCCPTSAWSRSTSASRPTAARPTPRRSSATSSTATTSTVTDSAPGALPGLDVPAAKAFVEAVGGDGQPEVRLDRRGPLHRRSACRPSTTAPATRAGAQAGGARADRRRSSAARPGCAAWLGARRRRPRVKDKLRGPVLKRRHAGRGATTTDQRLLDSRGPSDWVHTDPWRVLRIQAEFVEGFGALAELGPGDRRLRLRAHPGRAPVVRAGRAARGRSSSRRRLRGHHRRRARGDGGGQQGRQRGRRR